MLCAFKRSGALFSGKAGDLMQQVALCSDWGALEGNLIHRPTPRNI